MDPRSCDRMKIFSDRVSEGARTHTVCLVMAMVMVMVMVMIMMMVGQGGNIGSGRGREVIYITTAFMTSLTYS